MYMPLGYPHDGWTLGELLDFVFLTCVLREI